MSTPLRERPDAPLGTLIFRAGLLPAETIESALEEGVKTGKRLGEILTERGLISEVDLARLLAGQKGLEFVTLREQIVDPSAASLFTEEQARLFRALPYAFDGELPVVAIADPTDDVLMRNIREALGRTDARFVVSARSELADIASDVYSRPLTPAPSPEPEAGAEPEPAPEPEPDLAAREEHANGNAAADADLILQAPAYEPPAEQAPEPEPVPPAPEPAAFQVPALDPPAAPEPADFLQPGPEAIHEHETEPAEEPELAPTAPPAPEPPTVFETQVLSEPVPAPEAPVVPEPIPAPEPALRVEPPVAPVSPGITQPAVEAESLPPTEQTASSTPVPFPVPEPAPPYPPAAAAPETPVPAAPAPAPAAQEPTPPVESPAPSAAGDVLWQVTIRLTNGERVEAGDFPDQDSAKQEARVIMTQVADAGSGEWPFVNGSFLKPDTIVSVDIAELSPDS